MTDTKKLATNPERQEGEKELVSRRDAIKAIAQASLVALVGGLFTMGDNTAEAGTSAQEALKAKLAARKAASQGNLATSERVGQLIEEVQDLARKFKKPGLSRAEKLRIIDASQQKSEEVKLLCQAHGSCDVTKINDIMAILGEIRV